MAAMAEARQAGSLWTAEEDVLLLRHVAKYGTKHWGYLQTSGTLPHRDQKACCNRFILLKRKFFQARSRGQRLTFPVNPPQHSSPSSLPSSPTCSPPPSSSAAAGSAGASAAAAAATVASTVVPPRRASSGSPLGAARSSSPSCGVGAGVGLHGRSVPSFKPTFKHRGVADGGSAEVALRGALSAAGTRSMDSPSAKANDFDFDTSLDGGSFADAFASGEDALEAAMTTADTENGDDRGGAKQLLLSRQQPLSWGPSGSLEGSSCGDDLPSLMAETTAAAAAAVTSAMAEAVQLGGGAARAAAPAPLVRSSSLQPHRQQQQQQQQQQRQQQQHQQHLRHLLRQQQALLARAGSSNASSTANSPAAFMPGLSSLNSGNFAADLGLLAAGGGGHGDSAVPAPPGSPAAVSDAVVPDLLRHPLLPAQGSAADPAASASATAATAETANASTVALASVVGNGSPMRCWGSSATATAASAAGGSTRGSTHSAGTGGLQSSRLRPSGHPSVAAAAQLPDVKPKLLHAPSPWSLSQTGSGAWAAGGAGCRDAGASAVGSDVAPPCAPAGAPAASAAAAAAASPACPQLDASRSTYPDACLEQFSSSPGQMLFGPDSFRPAGLGPPYFSFGDGGDCSIPLDTAASAASSEPSAAAADWPGKGVLEQLLMADDDFVMGGMGMGVEAAVKAELAAAASAGASSAGAAALALGGPSMMAGLSAENCNELWEILRDVSSVLAPATCPQ